MPPGDNPIAVYNNNNNNNNYYYYYYYYYYFTTPYQIVKKLNEVKILLLNFADSC